MYTWAVNNLKLDRAIKAANGADEAEVQRIYISLGGKVVGPIIQKEAVEIPNDEDHQTPAKVIKEPKAK